MTRGLASLLALLLGGVVVGGGLAGAAAAADVTPTCRPPVAVPAAAGSAVACPVGRITVVERTDAVSAQRRVRAADPTLPSHWSVRLQSADCSVAVAPTGPHADETLSVPDGGSASSDLLFVYTDPGHHTPCSYTLSETPVDGVSTTYAVLMPFTLPDKGGPDGNDTSVVITNTYRSSTPPVCGCGSHTSTPPSGNTSTTSQPPIIGGTPTVTVTPTGSTGPTVTGTATRTGTPTVSRTASGGPGAGSDSASATASRPRRSSGAAGVSTSRGTSDDVVVPLTTSSSAAAELASTGPGARVGFTLLGGSALCVLGLVLLLTERVGRLAGIGLPWPGGQRRRH